MRLILPDRSGHLGLDTRFFEIFLALGQADVQQNGGDGGNYERRGTEDGANPLGHAGAGKAAGNLLDAQAKSNGGADDKLLASREATLNDQVETAHRNRCKDTENGAAHDGLGNTGEHRG